MTWGMWGSEEPCKHLKKLREFLEKNDMTVWSQHGQPNGWVNVHCTDCSRTYETVLQEPWCDECEGGECVCKVDDD